MRYLERIRLAIRLAGRQNFQGAAANTFWAWNYNGLNGEGVPTLKKNNGDILTLANNDFNINDFEEADLMDAGTTDPVYSGAITNRFNYKKLSLSFMFVGSGGHVLRRDSYDGQVFNEYVTSIHRDVAQAWRQPGDENTTDIPSFNNVSISPLSAQLLRNSTKNIVDATYIKLREVILTYNLPSSLLNSIFDSVVLNFRANNLFYWAKNDFGIDPEAHGIDQRFFKREPSYTFGINVGF